MPTTIVTVSSLPSRVQRREITVGGATGQNLREFATEKAWHQEKKISRAWGRGWGSRGRYNPPSCRAGPPVRCDRVRRRVLSGAVASAVADPCGNCCHSNAGASANKAPKQK
jgi:hypothetical protein